MKGVSFTAAEVTLNEKEDGWSDGVMDGVFYHAWPVNYTSLSLFLTFFSWILHWRTV